MSSTCIVPYIDYPKTKGRAGYGASLDGLVKVSSPVGFSLF